MSIETWPSDCFPGVQVLAAANRQALAVALAADLQVCVVSSLFKFVEFMKTLSCF